MSHFKVLPML